MVIPHPSHFISHESSTALRNHAADSEVMGKLVGEHFSIIYNENWLNLFVPEEYNGLNLSLTEGLKIEEGLAWADGSTGWLVTLCSGAAWFCGFLEKELSKNLFSNERACIAGSGQPAGIAKVVPGGFEITGHWKYASGTPHATAFTANCYIEENGIRQKASDGKPAVHAFLFLDNEVTIHEDWKSIGLIATSSHAFSVDKVEVPAERMFIIDKNHVVLPGLIYQYPFLQFAEATLAVNSSGMAIHFLDLCRALLEERLEEHYDTTRTEIMRKLLDTAEWELNSFRELFYEAVTSSWEALEKGLTPDLLTVSSTSRNLSLHARRYCDELYPHCGLAAVRPTSELSRVWRDIHTASQHPLLNYVNSE